VRLPLGRTQGKIGFQGGKVTIERPRVRELDGKEVILPSWERAVAEDWLGRWALNLMLRPFNTGSLFRTRTFPHVAIDDIERTAFPSPGAGPCARAWPCGPQLLARSMDLPRAVRVPRLARAILLRGRPRARIAQYKRAVCG
jgi:hypothetical protein